MVHGRLSVLFTLALVQAALASAQPTADASPSQLCQALPANIVAMPSVRDLVLELAAKSATLREQCASIGRAHHVRVIVKLVARPKLSLARATAEIRRSHGSSVVAVIEIPVTPDAAELIAHEFEHVVEQIEGVCLVTLARARSGGVSQSANGAFETMRAQRAGRRVAAEVRAAEQALD